jgi:hypothetical protein
MKFMVLIYNDASREPAYGTPDFDAMMGGYFAANEKMRADGVLVDGESLDGIHTARSLRITGDKVSVMDGPFAETREYFGGYYVLDCESMEKALEYAALIPSARFGTIEVRPLMNYNPAG